MTGFLNKAYQARDADSTRALYDDWAASYEAEVAVVFPCERSGQSPIERQTQAGSLAAIARHRFDACPSLAA